MLPKEGECVHFGNGLQLLTILRPAGQIFIEATGKMREFVTPLSHLLLYNVTDYKFLK